jgi:hypothetical protein
MTSKGVKPEELDESGVLIRLETQFAGETLSQAQVVRLIDLRHVTPKFVCESRFGFMTKAGWNECCQWVPTKDYKKRGLWGSKGDGSWYVIRYRHRALGWSVVRCRYTDLFTRRPDWWWVLDERGKLIAQPPEGFDSPEDAIEYAEHKINQRFSSMGRDHALAKWERYSLPGNDGYREILIQLDDWPGSYKPRHYRTRNVLVHIRTGVRETDDGSPPRQNSCRLSMMLNLGATRMRDGSVRRSIQEQSGGAVVAAGERPSGRGITRDWGFGADIGTMA